jgi:hypothetical protein
MKFNTARGAALARDAAMIARGAAPVARGAELAEDSCGSCRYFCESPHEIESQMPGMRSLGSGHASVRASDGICRRHDRYLAASSHCADYQQR